MKDLIERIEALERRMEKIERRISPMGKINADDNENETQRLYDDVNQPLTVVSTYGSVGKHREAQLTSTLTLALERLMHHRTPDGR